MESLEVQDQAPDCSEAQRGLSFVWQQPPSCCVLMSRQETTSLVSLLVITPVSFTELYSHNIALKTPPTNAITLGIRASICEFWGDMNLQSIACTQ